MFEARITSNSLKESIEIIESNASVSLSANLSSTSPIPYLSSVSFELVVSNSSESDISNISLIGDAQCSFVSSTCPGSLASGSTCTMTVKFKAKANGDLTCDIQTAFTYEGKTGAIGKTVSATGSFPGTASVEPVYPVNGLLWNHYVSRADKTKDENSQLDVTCTATGLMSYSDCMHAGQKKKVLTGMSSCTGLSITESLGVFQWTCDASSGEAIFYSNHFGQNKGLMHLLNATSWKSNSVSVYSGATLILSSPSLDWWANSVQVLPDASGSAVNLSTEDVIYTHSANQNSTGYSILADGVSIVSLNNSQIIYTSGTGIVILPTSRRRLWIEANFKGGTAQIYNNNTLYISRIHRSYFTQAQVGIGEGFSFSYIYNSIVSDSRFDKLTDTGLQSTTNFGGNLVWSSTFTNVGSYCIDAWSAKLTKYIQVFCANSTTNGIHTKYGGSLAAVSVFNVNGGALDQDYVESGGYINNVLFGNVAYGANLYRSIYNYPQLYSNLAIVATVGYSISSYVGTTSVKSQFTGSLLLGSANCTSNSTSGMQFAGIENGTCTTTGANLSNSYSAGSISTAVLRTGISTNSSITGQVTDTLNPHGASAFTAFGSITNWTLFQSMFRAFGVYQAGGNLIASSRAACTSGNCSIWDYSLSPGSPFKNSLGNGSVASSPALIAGATCPNVLHGDTVTYTLETTPRAFLANAFEVPISPMGNHDGLCESGEACIYTPNFGAYQGTGDFWSNSCVFQNGVVSNVKMYGYPL